MLLAGDTRGAIAVARGVKPWQVQVSERADGGVIAAVVKLGHTQRTRVLVTVLGT